MTGKDGETAFDFAFKSLEGHALPLSVFAGRPLVIVNTASACGFTPQYEALEALWTANRERGLTVLGVPSNDFGAQEPGTSAEIREFCSVRFGVDFPLTEKVRVKGAEAHPLFQWLAAKGGWLSQPRWNFYKYLIGPDGTLRDWFASATAPGSRKFARAVNRLFD